MKTYGKTRSTTHITTLNDLGSLVECVEKLPDLSTLPVGCVCQLIGSQPGYIATHLYKVVLNAVSVKEWQDITLSDYTLLVSDPTAKYVECLEAGTGRIQVIACWDACEEVENDIWVMDVLMRKDGSYPKSLNDGEEVVRSKVNGEYTQDHMFLSGYLRDAETDKFFYRLFHVYKSGAKKVVNLTEGSPTSSYFAQALTDFGLTVA